MATVQADLPHHPASGLGLPRDRSVEPQGAVALPEGTVLISSDDHWSISSDVFYERAPDHLKERMPRVSMGPKGVSFIVNGQPMLPDFFADNMASFELIPGCSQIAPRLADLDRQGVEQSILFGNSVVAFFGFPDLEVREWVFRIHNQHMAEVQTESGNRLHGVGFINYWDPTRARDSVAEVVDLGLKGLFLPQNPKGANDESLNYRVPEMDPMWAAIEESGLPLCFHVGEFAVPGPGGTGTSVLQNLGPFRKNLGELIFGGIFDRFPGLKVVFTEAGIDWVAPALIDAEMIYESYQGLLDPHPQHRPQYYWQRNCYATFMWDPIGLRLLDDIGVDRVMWSSDYPHPESNLGYEWKSIQAVVDAVPPDDARKILGDTARELYRL